MEGEKEQHTTPHIANCLIVVNREILVHLNQLTNSGKVRFQTRHLPYSNSLYNSRKKNLALKLFPKKETYIFA